MEVKPKSSIIERFQEVLGEERQSSLYQNYLMIRDWVLRMLEENEKQQINPSKYWEEEVSGFDYMLDASPLIIKKLREHCYHITGLRSYDYRDHHNHLREQFAEKLKLLKSQDPTGLLVPETPELGGFGHRIDGDLINLDTLKYYEALIGMNKVGILGKLFEEGTGRPVVVEIGAGWGGLTYQLKRLYPQIIHIIIDLPQSLLFSAVYLTTLFENCAIFKYGDKPLKELMDRSMDYDFVFLPNYCLNDFNFPKIDLTVNIASFQEMTTEQVSGYVRKVFDMSCPHFYSLNRDCSPHNRQLSSVSAILGNYYRTREVKVLDVPYTDLSVKKNAKFSYKKKYSGLKQILNRRVFGSAYTNRDNQPSKGLQYRHIVGELV